MNNSLSNTLLHCYYQSYINIFDRSIFGLGNFKSIVSRVLIIICATAKFLNHLLLAGIIYQGMCLVLHFLSISSYAKVYSSHNFRPIISLSENFHCFIGSLILSSSLFFRSSLLMCKNNLTIFMLFSNKYFSNSLI